jgi:membrane-associated protein
MDWLAAPIDLIVHLDDHLLKLTTDYGRWAYAILFLIVFCETGLVVTPFLPGDSLLFVAGTLAGAGSLNVHLLAVTLFTAAVVGDSLNYAIGHWTGPKVFRFENSWFFKREYLERTHRFFERHGGKTIVLARFMPIIRTYAPFVAGIGRMRYPRFLFYNVIGALAWVGSLTYAGYWFGNLPVIRDNLTLVIVVIVLLSISPAFVEYFRQRRRGQPS